MILQVESPMYVDNFPDKEVEVSVMPNDGTSKFYDEGQDNPIISQTKGMEERRSF